MPKKGTKSKKPKSVALASFRHYRKTLDERVRRANQELALCGSEIEKVDNIILSLQPQETDQPTGG